MSKRHSSNDTVDIEWDQGNQQWWDWYVSLAEDAETPSEPTILPQPEILTPPTQQKLAEHLTEVHSLTEEQVNRFRSEGYLKLKNVMTAEALSKLRGDMAVLFRRACESGGARFGSLDMMWDKISVLMRFVFSRKLAKLAGDLLGVTAVRLYHDNGLSKEPGCGRTPWHYDAHHFPIATNNVCTVWIPLQPVPRTMGPLCFARGFDTYRLVEDVSFNKFDTSYDRQIIDRFREHRVEVDDTAFELGEISFHHNLNFHTAGPNHTNISRMVLATTYFEDGARVIENPHLVNGDWRKFMPGIEPAQTINSPLNPVLFSSEEMKQE